MQQECRVIFFRKNICLSVLSFAACVSTVFGAEPLTFQDGPTPIPPPIYNAFEAPYLSLNIGAAYAGPMNYNNGVATTRYSKSGLRGEAASAYLGDQINPYFAFELGFNGMDYPPMGSLFLMSFDMRLTAPIGQRFSLFGKIGPGLAEVKTCNNANTVCETTSTTVPAFGAGLGYGFASRWMATLEYNGTYMPESTGNAVGNFGALTLGATYYFVW